MDQMQDKFDADSEDRFGLSSPVFIISLISVYLLFVYKIGPAFMKNREPYKLKTFILIYNALQVLACVYIVLKILQLTSWDIFDFSICSVYAQNTPERMAYDKVTYFAFWIKNLELIDTICFVLRKKQTQVTPLHVFHHSSVLTLVYIVLNYHRGNGALYPLLLNSVVHIVMYSYYFLANVCGPVFMRRLLWFKKSITIVQMVQFMFILLQAGITWRYCGVPMVLTSYFSLVIAVIFYGFYDFYKKAYKPKVQS
ncbi:elongation of very long chain fatty acids protein F [Stomoxys calcitrans]|uniref:elongation of very long chain fatty acids protein F n=1 Tax=Stomoxys calcitrans TaxID=35570 RepID=UPI0027E23C74|nr:elongation of very long chain fatty acids protein F [Stomoxys calcitrans]